MVRKITNWYLRYKIHLLVWFVYMTYEALSVGVFFGDFKSPIVYLSHYAIVFVLFYVHSDFVLPNGLKNKRNPLLIVSLILLEVSLYMLCQYIVSLTLVFAAISETQVSLNSNFIIRNLYRGLLFLGFSTGYYFLKTYLAEHRKTEELEQERLKNIIEQQKIEQELVVAQNAFLKAQINPHFLFNTLDFVYHKVNVHSQVAGEVIEKLAEMMRFAIDSEHMGSTIHLLKEIEQVENLLYLYQVRKSGDLNIHFEYEREVKELYLVPLVVITLVENIFKHGDLSNADEIASISLRVEDDIFQIKTFNLINVFKADISHHSGLNNIKKRLIYAYGEKVSFDYRTIGNHFQVLIELPLQLLKQPV